MIRRHQRGFTLIEVVAVVVLIGLALVAVSVTLGEGLAGAKVRAASRDLAAALRYTRTQAIVQREAQALTIDVEARAYRRPAASASSCPRAWR